VVNTQLVRAFGEQLHQHRGAVDAAGEHDKGGHGAILGAADRTSTKQGQTTFFDAMPGKNVVCP
jgi:hypothetical protein